MDRCEIRRIDPGYWLDEQKNAPLASTRGVRTTRSLSGSICKGGLHAGNEIGCLMATPLNAYFGSGAGAYIDRVASVAPAICGMSVVVMDRSTPASGASPVEGTENWW